MIKIWAKYTTCVKNNQYVLLEVKSEKLTSIALMYFTPDVEIISRSKWVIKLVSMTCMCLSGESASFGESNHN